MEEIILKNLNDFKKLFPNGVFEAHLRNKNGTYGKFVKIFLNELEGDSKDKVLNKISKQSTQILKATKSMQINIKTVKNLQMISSFIGAANLCSTVAGFVIVCNKLNGISDQIQNVMSEFKKAHEEETLYKFDRVLEDHKAMLDGKEGGLLFSEEQYRNLISEEYTVLKQLYKSFMNETCENQLQILQVIVELSSMMSCAIQNYDVVYWYNHQEKKSFFVGHDSWIEMYNSLLSEDFLEKVQDLFFINENKTQYETDILLEGIAERFINNARDIMSMDTVISNASTQEEYNKQIEENNKQADEEINQFVKELNLENDEEVMNIVNVAKQQVGLPMYG